MMIGSCGGARPALGRERNRLSLRAGVLRDCLGTLADGVLGELAGQQESDRRLHLPGRDRGTLVVMRQTRSLGGDALEYVVHERVHDRHRLAGDTGVGVDLFQHLVNVDGVALLPLVLLLFLICFGDVLLGLAGLLGRLTAGLGRHFIYLYLLLLLLLLSISE